MSDTEASDVTLDPRDAALQAWAAAADRAARTDLLQYLFNKRRELRPRLTQAQVAARMGISQATVSAFESRKAVPRLSTLQRYARAIGVRLRITLDDVAPEVEFADRLTELDTDRVADRGGRDNGRPVTAVPDEAPAQQPEEVAAGPLHPRFSAFAS